MSNETAIIKVDTLVAIGDAIRFKRDIKELIKVSDLANQIRLIETGGTAEIYKGKYIVTPRTHHEILNTKRKYLEDNVTVLSIPYNETSNLAGGLTAVIASI